MFEVVFCGVSLAIVWGAMAERTKLWVYFAFGAIFTLIYSFVSHWVWSPDGWLFARGMQDFAGSTVVHYQGALAGLAGALLLGPRIGKIGKDGKSNAIPGHNMAFTTLGVIILWFGWFGFNPGSTLSVDFPQVGFFAYVALNTNLAAAAGVLGAVVTSWLVIKKPDLSMMLNGAIGGARGDHRRVRVRRPVGGDPDRVRRRRDRRAGRPARRPDRDRRSRRRGRRARHVRHLGHARARLLHRAGAGRRSSRPATAGCSTAAGSTSSAPRRSALLAVGAFTFTASFVILFIFKKTFGIRTEPEVEEAGLDVSEHGMWGYPEFYIPVPGGYGTDSASHLTGANARAATAVAPPAHSPPCDGRRVTLPPAVWRGGPGGRPAHHELRPPRRC